MTKVVPSRSDFIGKAKVIPANPNKLFLQFQDDWIADNSRIKLMEKSRQITYVFKPINVSCGFTMPKVKLIPWPSHM